MEKLRIFAGDTGTVSDEDARWLVRGEQEALIWDYCHAVLAAQPQRALEELSALLRQGESEVSIVIVLSIQVRMAALAACLVEAGLLNTSGFQPKLRPGAEVYLPRKKSGEPIDLWQLGNSLKRAQKRSVRFWVRAVERLFEVNEQLVSGAANPTRLLELMTLELAGR